MAELNLSTRWDVLLLAEPPCSGGLSEDCRELWVCSVPAEIPAALSLLLRGVFGLSPLLSHAGC